MSRGYDDLYDAGRRWRPWQLESFDEPEVDTSNDTAEVHGDAGPALPDPEQVLAEIERLREAAKARGHAEGYAVGHEQGIEAGLKEGREQGLREGLEAGHAEGYAQGQEAARLEVETLQQIAQAGAHAIEHFEEATGEALLSLATSIAEQVLRSTLAAEPQRILDLIREVLHVDGGQQGLLKFRLNPQDVELVEQYLKEDGTLARWRIQADPDIERGGCIAETALGTIDATLQTRWQRVVSAMGAAGAEKA